MKTNRLPVTLALLVALAVAVPVFSGGDLSAPTTQPPLPAVPTGKAPPEVMKRDTILYALSTIAQCAAALAALIGFLGLWRLDRLRDIMREDEDEMIAAVLQIIQRAGDLIPIRGRAHFLQRAREFVKGLRSAPSPWVTEEGRTIDEEAKQIIAGCCPNLDFHGKAGNPSGVKLGHYPSRPRLDPY